MSQVKEDISKIRAAAASHTGSQNSHPRSPLSPIGATISALELGINVRLALRADRPRRAGTPVFSGRSSLRKLWSGVENVIHALSHLKPQQQELGASR